MTILHKDRKSTSDKGRELKQKKTALLALICLAFTACDDSDTFSDGDGKVTLSAACTAVDEAGCTTAPSGKNYYFALTEETNEFNDCDDFLDENTGEVNPAAATYFSSTEKTSESTVCTVDGCDFSTTKTYNQDGAKVSGLKAGIYISVLWVDGNDDGSLNSGDFISCLDDDDAPVITDEDSTITYELEALNF
ncbi:MAG: hypothetical protein ACRBBP_04945 [Bdellovibrionales bacterium]